MKSKIWSTQKADTIFSLFIRSRDKKCVRCGKIENLQCSHYWSRMHSAIRYDPENADTLDAGCHLYRWEVEKQGEYRDYMIKKLGESGYEALRRRAQSIKPRKEAIKEFMEWHEKLSIDASCKDAERQVK